jgi:hypothetical protein
MNAETLLSAYMEVAIGLAGFAGIIGALKSNAGSIWTDQHRLLFQVLLASSGLNLLLAATPFLVNSIPEMIPFGVWNSSSLVGALLCTFAAILRTRQLRRIGASVRPIFIMVVPVILSYCANIYFGYTWAYLLLLTLGLAIAFVMFVQLIVGLVE